MRNQFNTLFHSAYPCCFFRCLFFAAWSPAFVPNVMVSVSVFSYDLLNAFHWNRETRDVTWTTSRWTRSTMCGRAQKANRNEHYLLILTIEKLLQSFVFFSQDDDKTFPVIITKSWPFSKSWRFSRVLLDCWFSTISILFLFVHFIRFLSLLCYSILSFVGSRQGEGRNCLSCEVYYTYIFEDWLEIRSYETKNLWTEM